MASIVTRINVGDYDTWKTMFDRDEPGARRDAKGHKVLRSVDDPNEVFVVVEFSSVEEANAGRDRLVSSGVLDRFADHDQPKVVEEAESVGY
jgi:heme-degrading monooxygenase HmoA